MPKGVHIKDHLDEPDFKILFTTLKHSNLKETDFAAVATDMGLKDATFARGLFNRTMKAQGKGSAPKKAAAKSKPASKRSAAKANDDDTEDDGTTATPKKPAKKRKVSTAASSEATTERDDMEDAEVKAEKEIKEESGTEDGEDD